MNVKELSKIKLKHNKLRVILQSYGCEEFGDCIIDDICNLFDYPNTILYYEDEVEE